MAPTTISQYSKAHFLLSPHPIGLGAYFWSHFFSAVSAISFAAIAIAFFISSHVQGHAIENAAVSAATFIQGVIEPLVQSLPSGRKLSNDERQSLDKLLVSPAFKKNVVGFKIWQPDGTIVYSDEKGLEGVRREPHEELRAALRGEVTTSFRELPKDNTGRAHSSVPLVEVHAPLRTLETTAVIGAAQFSINADEKLDHAYRTNLAFALAFAFLAAMTGLAVISRAMQSGSRSFVGAAPAPSALAGPQKAFDVPKLVPAAAPLPAAGQSKLLREVLADLHDGPAQLLALALIKLDEFDHRRGGSVPSETINAVRGATGDALKEIRNILRTCVNPEAPEIADLPLDDVLRLTVQLHERRTRTTVAKDVGPLPPVPAAVAKCICQFVREALFNALWHAGGRGQALSAHYGDGAIVVEVRDGGREFKTEPENRNGERGFGLVGMRDRVMSNGGTMEIYPSSGSGTRIVVKFILDGGSDGRITPRRPPTGA